MICFDTPIVIWGVQGVADSTQTVMIDRTRRYIESLAASRERVMIPSVVASEYLAAFRSETERARQMMQLERYFYVPPLDAPAATVAATLFDNSASAASRTQGWRQRLKADCYIVATAIVHGAKVIVTSSDELPKFIRIAGGRIKVIEVPIVPKQTSLIDDES